MLNRILNSAFYLLCDTSLSSSKPQNSAAKKPVASFHTAYTGAIRKFRIHSLLQLRKLSMCFFAKYPHSQCQKFMPTANKFTSFSHDRTACDLSLKNTSFLTRALIASTIKMQRLATTERCSTPSFENRISTLINHFKIR
jgi:hypothetical protein